MAKTVSQVQAAFEAAGASFVEPGYLQSADLLLDLYGEDIRARAYRTYDPVEGEMMLRPDFTVPIVQNHMATGASPAKYTYAGPVWRRQSHGSRNAREFWQVGFEIFDSDNPANADAEIFALFDHILKDQNLAPITGDLTIVFAAIDALATSETRQTALRRHVWRPNRFSRLLARFAGEAPFDCDTRKAQSPDAPHIGLRTQSEIDARLERLRQEAATPDISQEEVAMVTALLELSGSMASCANGLAAIARSFPSLKAVQAQFERRMEALEARDIDTSALPFDGAFGRGSMEYYDGFTFAFQNDSALNVAQGGRYDALTGLLGNGTISPAVGGIIRPAELT